MTTINIPADSDFGVKPWSARVSGRKAGKFPYQQEFLPQGITTTPGLFRASARKNGTTWFLVQSTQDGLVRITLAASTAEEILDRLPALPSVRQTDDGKWTPRDQNGDLMWGVNRDSLMAERDKLLARLAEIDALLAGASE